MDTDTTRFLAAVAQRESERAIAAAASDPLVPGAIATVIAPRIGLRWLGASGADRLGGSVAPSPRQPFRIASITKVFVATTALRLVEEGRLQLQTSIDHLISDSASSLLIAGGYDVSRMTLAHLLCHISGLPDHTASAVFEAAVPGGVPRPWTRYDQIALAMTLGSPLAAPGLLFHYSDTGYVLVGEIIERITGTPLATAVRRLCKFDQLGLTKTYWESVEPGLSPAIGRARQYAAEVDTTDFDPSFDMYGGGGLVSTVSELAEFMRALIGGQVLAQPGSLEIALQIPDAERQDGDHLHSHLARKTTPAGLEAWGHGGAWGCTVAHVPDLDITVAATLNQLTPSDPKTLANLVQALIKAAADPLRARDGRAV